ncbi:MAG: ABC transporter permease subunit [Spirochaetales bacterium]|nr:ABC transporter permease subunit [Spirochaetales bacterium]
MTIFLYELKMYRKSIIIWCSSISGMMFMFMAIYPSFAADASLMEMMLANYPEEFLKAFGMAGNLSLSSVLGYFGFTFVYIQLCLAIQSANYGFHFLSVEERELTADFLMSKPVSRRKIFISKFMAAFAALSITNIVVGLVSLASVAVFNDGNEWKAVNIVVLISSTVFFQLFFVSIGMLISVSVKKIRSVLAFSMSLSFGLYILNAMRGIFGGELLGIITPFYHFEPGYILEFGRYNIEKSVISFAIIFVSIVISWVLYSRRNIHSL